MLRCPACGKFPGRPASDADGRIVPSVIDSRHRDDDIYRRRRCPHCGHRWSTHERIVTGVDPYYDDELGGLALTRAGLEERDRAVFREVLLRHRVPVVATLAGGYARRLEDTVALHAATLAVLGEVQSEARRLGPRA